MTHENIGQYGWLPKTCAYRLLDEGKPLPDWHPLITGDPKTVVQAGVSAMGRIVSEEGIDDEDAVNYIVRRNSSLYSRLPLKGRFVRRRDLLRKLKKLGCSFVRPGGSHDIWQGPAGKFQVPRHAGDLATGTVKDILRRSGIGLRVRDLRLS
jgi:predicted RNA binding protein YcfA (HicA-like mRNA interferase family)